MSTGRPARRKTGPFAGVVARQGAADGAACSGTVALQDGQRGPLRHGGTAEWTPANPLSACAYHEPTRVAVGAFRHPTEALICRYVA